MAGKIRTAMEQSASYLSRRFHTVCELRKKLYATEKFPAGEIEETIQKLIRIGFLNDRRYALDAAEVLKQRGYGPLRIKNQFRLKGIAPELIDQAIRNAFSGEDKDPLNDALDLLAKKASLARETDPVKRKAKALRFLAGRGYEASTAYAAVSKFYHTGSFNDFD